LERLVPGRRRYFCAGIPFFLTADSLEEVASITIRQNVRLSIDTMGACVDSSNARR